MKDKTIEEIESSFEILETLITKFVKDEERRDKLCEIFSGEFGKNFMMAPASSKEEYHSSYVGGLFDHTVWVISNIQKLNKELSLGLDPESAFVAALLHDAGKAMSADLSGPLYVLAEEWKAKRGQRFDIVKSPYFTTRDRTLFFIQFFGFRLTQEEFQAIMLNDGYVMEGNRSYAMKECPLAFWLSVADSWAAREEKEAKTSEKS